MALIERKMLAFPGQSATAATQVVGTIIAAANPGHGPQILYAYANRSPSLAPTTIVPQERRIDLAQRRNSDGPVTAICIAPDSAIHTCDISLHGKHGEFDRHRVSPGNPIIGIPDDVDFAMVSVPVMPPAVQVTDLVSHVDVLWDSGLISLPSVGTIGGWPLRLEVWRGTPVPLRQHWRACYAARCVQLLQDAGSGEGSDDASFWVCVDGRRKIDVIVGAVDPVYSSSFTVSIDAIEPYTNSTVRNVDDYRAIPLALDLAGNTSQVISNTTPAVFSFDGNPMTLMRVNAAIVAVAGAQVCRAHINVRAWD